MPLDAAQWQIQITAADKTSAAFASLEKRIDSASKKMDELGKASSTGALGAAMEKGLGAASGALLRYTKLLAPAAVAAYAFQQSMKFADIEQQATALGMSADAFQTYKLMALEAGVGSKQFDSTLQGLASSMQSANLGNADAISKFDKLGVKLLDANGKLRPVDDILPEVARGLLNVSSETERAAAAQDIFGASAGKVLAMLPQLTTGSRELTDIARQQGKLLSGEAVAGWEKMNTQLELLKTNADIAIGVLATPFVASGFEKLNDILRQVIENLDRVKREGATAAQRTAQAAAVGDVKQLESELAAQQGLLAVNPNNFAAKASVKALQGRIEAARAAETLARQTTMEAEDAAARGLKLPVSAPAATVGTSQPTVRGGTTAGGGAPTGEDSAERRLGVLLAERQALERAMQAFSTKFNIRENDSVAEVEKKLQRSVDLEKQIANLTKNVPKDSAVAQALTEEATRLSELAAQWEEYRKIVVGAEGTIARYGDGSKELARTQNELNKQLAAGKITQEEYNWAMKDATEKAKQQELAARGAAGGFGGFAAGIESVLRPASQMSREFQYGQKAMNLLDDAISQMVNNGEVNFQRLLASFITMIAQMEARAAVAQIWGMFGGNAGGSNAGGGIASTIIGGLSSIIGGAVGGSIGGPSLSTLQGGIGPGGQVLLFADGGRPPVGRASIVGERGPELFVPDSAGSILNQEQVAGMGGTTVIVQQTVHVGEYVTSSQYAAGLRAVEQSAREGAMAGIINKRKRGGLKDVFN